MFGLGDDQKVKKTDPVEDQIVDVFGLGVDDHWFVGHWFIGLVQEVSSIIVFIKKPKLDIRS